eukprot:TRINITY_DN2100_c0_g3_i4.p1 TRINITY_DN2100_c0_g3~~TRINITY_DN2100_c0_g3_i4.p1  ORF type:complete len:834 (+),score=232.29 TRINITY_DN2100_c0_g3_i4:312-2504(+)
MYAVQHFAALRSTPYRYGTAYILVKDYNASACGNCTPPWLDPEGYSRSAVWWDPVLDNNGNVQKFWAERYVVAKRMLNGKPGYDPVTHVWSKIDVAINNDTSVPDPQVWTEYLTEDVPAVYDWMMTFSEEGAWTPTYFWNSVDGTPYAYNGYNIRYPIMHNGQLYLLLLGYFMFRPWSEAIYEFESEHTNLIVIESHSRVYAHTLNNEPVIKHECHTICLTCNDFTGTECLLDVNGLGPTVSAAVNASRVRGRNIFFTASLPSTHLSGRVQYGEYYAPNDTAKAHPLYKKDYYVVTRLAGGEYFIRLTKLYQAEDTTFELLWMRSVSSVNNQVYAALVQLILACVVIFIVDIIIAVAEVLLISRPLEKIVVGNQYLETMDLDEAERMMKAIYKPLMAREVARVIDGLVMAIRGLREYKAFLPSTLFVVGEESDEVLSSSSATHTGSTTFTTRSNGSQAKRGGAVSTAIQCYKGVVAKLQFDRKEYPSFPMNFAVLVEAINDIGQATRGVVHGFSLMDPFAFIVTWNIGQHCTDCHGNALMFSRRVVECTRITDVAMPTVAVASGQVQAGNLGSATNRGFAISGSVSLHVDGISSVAGAMYHQCREAVILVSPAIAEAGSGRFRFHALTLLRFEGGKTPMLLRQFLGSIEVRPEEWMYQLEEAASFMKDPLLEPLTLLQRDYLARPGVEFLIEPTKLQKWAGINIRQGRAVSTYGVSWGVSDSVRHDLLIP